MLPPCHPHNRHAKTKATVELHHQQHTTAVPPAAGRSHDQDTALSKHLKQTLFAPPPGSGKTFTMTGGAERYVDRGIIPRAISVIFQAIAASADTQYQVGVGVGLEGEGVGVTASVIFQAITA